MISNYLPALQQLSFGTIGIRDRVENLSPEVCFALVRAFVSACGGPSCKNVVLGHDLRPSSPAMAQACAAALAWGSWWTLWGCCQRLLWLGMHASSVALRSWSRAATYRLSATASSFMTPTARSARPKSRPFWTLCIGPTSLSCCNLCLT